MSKHRSEYLIVFFVLGILTLIEIWIAGNASGDMKVWTLITLAFAKAACVATFYMHLKSERNWLRLIAILPAITGIFAYVLIQEVIYR